MPGEDAACSVRGCAKRTWKAEEKGRKEVMGNLLEKGEERKRKIMDNPQKYCSNKRQSSRKKDKKLFAYIEV